MRDGAAGGVPGQEVQSFAPQDDHTRAQALKDTRALGASYDRYLQTAQPLPSYGPAQAGTVAASMPAAVRDLPAPRAANASLPYHDHPLLFPAPLPPDASSTLYVEGLPRDATEREVAHIFRPFLGYKEVRLVKKEPKYDGGNPVLLCFVDFTSPSYAVSAMNAVEGYAMDLHDRESSVLRVEFAKFTARRPVQGFRGKRDRY